MDATRPAPCLKRSQKQAVVHGLSAYVTGAAEAARAPEGWDGAVCGVSGCAQEHAWWCERRTLGVEDEHLHRDGVGRGLRDGEALALALEHKVLHLGRVGEAERHPRDAHLHHRVDHRPRSEVVEQVALDIRGALRSR